MADKKYYLEADITLEKETADLKAKASKVIDLPAEREKQQDLLYFSAIFVSTGENLNHAYFMGSELVLAEDTIINKALDVEHSEDEIIGHIYERAYMDKEGNPLDLKELASLETANQDGKEMHIAIAGIVYKNRFPHVAQEVSDNKWKVSMECYYKDYDVKVGDLILNKNEAEALGLASHDDSILGRIAKVIKGGKEIAEGAITRVLRGIQFSGCGIVKNPANPPSVIMETANEKEKEMANNEVIILDYDKLESDDINLTSDKLEEANDNTEEAKDGELDDSIGICVSYNRRMYDKAGAIVANDWCSLYEASCTSFSRDTTDPDCLRNRELRTSVATTLEETLEERAENDKRNKLLSGLKAALREAVESISR